MIYPKSARLLKRSQYIQLMRHCQKFNGEGIRIEYRLGKAPCPRLGITVSRRFGKAHLRNLFKRRVREVFRHLSPLLPETIELNVIPRKPEEVPSLSILLCDFQRMVIDVKSRAETSR